jgi:diguanylate cyclase (GGDEF)-like protein/PAS domain S-box-containing protein
MDPLDHEGNNGEAASHGDREHTHADAPIEGYRWMRSVLENSSENVTVVDPDGTLRYASPAFGRMLGYNPEEAVGTMNVLDHVHPEDLSHVLEETQKALSEGGVTTNRAEYRFRHKDGSWRWVESVGTYLLDDPDVEGVVVQTRDITERKEVEEALKEAEQRYRTLVERVPPIIYIQRPKEGQTAAYDTTYISPRVEEILGYPPGRFLEDPGFWDGLIHPDDRKTVRAEDERTDLTGEPFFIEYRMITREGRTVWVRDEATLVRDVDGEPLYWLGIQTDVTERKVAEERYRTLVERMPAVTYIEEVEGIRHTLYTSPQIEDLLGYPQEKWLDDLDHWKGCIHPEDRERVLAQDDRCNLTGEPFKMEYRLIHLDGSVVWVHDEAVLVEGPDEQSRFWQGVFTDITERKALEGQLKHRALHDPLTDLPNRQLLVDRLEHALRRTRRRRGRRVAVLLMDLDNFKSVNDSLGHEVGDLLLVAVAERLKSCLRPEDTVARFGGDEFVVLLEDSTGPDEAVRVKERIAEAFKRPFVLEGRQLFVSASIGIALGDDHTESPEDLLRNADTAMYEAKSEAAAFGHRVFDPGMHKRVLIRLSLENDLRRAIEQEEFQLYYQPKVRLMEEDTIVEVEALLRWQHPQRGLLLPEEFISLAEQTVLIVPIGRWVLKEACRQVKEWQDRYPRVPPLVACVNVSAGQLRYPDLLDDVGTALGESGVEARSLVLEITESALVKDMPASMEVLKELRDLGIRFALDDFGSEYSSLSYLMRLPVDFVKIDKSFVWGLGEDPKATVIVEAIISLVHSLGLEAVGEGVESAEQLMRLRSMGCDLVQGFHLSEPKPSEEVDRLLPDRPIS